MKAGRAYPQSDAIDGQEGGIRRAAAQVDYPLTFMQREIWFQCQLRADAPLYHIGVAATIAGTLDRTLFLRAFRAVVERQSVLRTAFRAAEDGPRQVILPEVAVELPYEDLSGDDLPHLDDLALRTRVTERFFQIAGEPFDLGRAPLWRAVLLRVAEHEHWLFCLFHHLIVDGHHAGALLGEIGAAYWRLAQGDESPPAPLPLEYRDYAVWLDARRRDGRLAGDAAYWLEQLRTPRSDAILPRDRLPPACRRFVTDGFWFQLDATMAEALARCGRTCRATPYRLLVAVFAMMVGRLTGARDVVVGQPFSTQPPALQGVAGQFANALPVWIRLDRRQSFKALAAAVSRALDEARRRRAYPIIDAFRQMQADRDRQNVAPVRVGASHVSHIDLQLPGFRVEQRPSVFSAAQRYELWLGVKELSSGISLTFGYAAELFERETIARFATCFQALLAGAIEHPDRAIGALDMVPEADRRAVIVTWNSTARSYHDACIHELVERQARQAPDAPALSLGSATLTYGELDARANRLAHWLRGRGVASETLVPLVVDRSVDLVVAMLAVLKAGAGYVAWEPGAPVPGLRRLLEGRHCPVLLTGRSRLDEARAAGDVAGEVLCLDDRRAAAAGSAGPPQPIVVPASTAYISAGDGDACATLSAPRGIIVPHRAVVRLVQSQDYVDVGPSDRILQHSPCGCDAAAFEIWGALINGAHLVLAPASIGADVDRLAEIVRTERVTVLYLTAAFFNQAIDAHADTLAGLTTLIIGGGLAPVAQAPRAAAALAPARVVRMYGPPENGAFSTWQLVSGVAAGGPAIRIGRPIATSTAYVLDEDLRPVPIKVQGEICVGGDGLARGYLREPAETAARFVPSPFTPGGRLFRTGDRGRWHPDGTLELVGRQAPQAADERARPAPVEPETETERQIAAVWRDVLGAAHAGLHDNFFEIGGDSIAWVRIAARLRAKGLPIGERDLVDHRTIAALAACVEARALLWPPPAGVDARDTAEVDEDELAALLGAEGGA